MPTAAYSPTKRRRSYWSIRIGRRLPEPRMGIGQQQDQVLTLIAHVVFLHATKMIV
jgi:hypothetical protein